ncbi:unknown function [Klebsiella phage vB_Kpl_K72PH164C2]|uniref:Uncharacterized protein n=1 Tax=Klebsiella phage vB_Kpl_K72PH164C2 TaxID=3071646 RepID=A0AAD2GQ67_9CAUD|nr:unknown function [Klebsiella phage vB_Kpl_K72PH164C2]
MISALSTAVVPEEALVKRQLELEETYKIRGIERARKLITDALQNGGIMNLPMTQRMLTSAYEVAAAAIDEMRNVKAPGIGGKYRRFLRLIPPADDAAYAHFGIRGGCCSYRRDAKCQSPRHRR